MGAELFYPGVNGWSTGERSKPFTQDSFSWTTQLDSFDDSEWHAEMTDFLRKFYDLVGMERAEMFTSAHIEANSLLPLG